MFPISGLDQYNLQQDILWCLNNCKNVCSRNFTPNHQIIRIHYNSQFRITKLYKAQREALDLWSTDREFKSYSGQKLRNNLGQVVYTYVLLSPSSITWYRPAKGRWWSAVGKVTAGLAESNGSLPGWLPIPGSAPGPMLGNEYGKPLPSPF